MFKRLFWLVVGTAVGFTGSVWLQRRLRQRIERYAPEQVADRVSTSVRSITADARAAARLGREAAREKEESLRAQLRPPAF
jgi:CO dehydrogenase/acetyl-CoA synthase beta subunit